MILLKLAIKSLRNRKLTAGLTMLSISLSVILLLSVERTKRAAEDGFTQAVSQTDLLVGARTGPLNLILYTVFNMGSASNNVSWQTYQEIKNKPEIEWTIPYSLGDGHRGFRVIGTDKNFYEYYRYRGNSKIELDGAPALGIWDVVVGSEVATKLGYKIGDSVVIDHGVTRSEGIIKHEDKPFRIVGIIRSTGTAIDQSLYVSLYGMEAIHMDWKNGLPSQNSNSEVSKIKVEDIKINAITAFFVRNKSRIQTLKIQREINEYKYEALLAIIPGATLGELWKGLSQIGIVLKFISILVLIVGMASMVSTLLASLNERRREMAILRSVGAMPIQITILLVFESFMLSLSGLLFGVLVSFAGFFFLSGWLESQFGFYLVGPAFIISDLLYLGLILSMGILVGFIPAIKASRSALKDGLAIKI